MNERAAQAILNSYPPFSSFYIASPTTATVSLNPGMLASVFIGAISCPTIGIFDATSITGTPKLVFGPNAPVGNYGFDIAITSGIVLQIAAGATPAVTVSYK